MTTQPHSIRISLPELWDAAWSTTHTIRSAYRQEALDRIAESLCWLHFSDDARKAYGWHGITIGTITMAQAMGLLTTDEVNAKRTDADTALRRWQDDTAPRCRPDMDYCFDEPHGVRMPMDPRG